MRSIPIALSLYLVDASTGYKEQIKSILLSFTVQPWATSQVGYANPLFQTYPLKKCVIGCVA